MLTLTKIRAQIFEFLNQYSNYSNIEPRFIDDLVAQKRAIFARQDREKTRSIDDNLIQDLGCIELELVSRIQCGCEEISSDCQILRSTVQIPNALEFYNDKAITRIASLDIMDKAVLLMDYDQAIFWGNGRFNKSALGAFIRNNYVYIIYNKGAYHSLLEKINVQGVFEDPKAAAKFKTCEGVPCWNVDSKYPLNAWMWEIIRPEIIKEIMIKYQLPVDLDNNAKDDSAPTTNTPTGK